MAILGLDVYGFLLALVIAFISYNYGGLNYLILLLSFFLLSMHATSLGYRKKYVMKIYDHKRGLSNVLSNGLFPALFSYLNMPYAFAGSVAAITADKFASEIGVLGNEPIELFTWKKTRIGASGAVSKLGLIASFTGSLTIAVISAYLFNLSNYQALIIAISGFIGSFADSIAGFFEERGFGNKATSNLICSIVGGVVSHLFLNI
ncbi:MAG: DUF92 domain-containing protein [Candidatus Anstonellales archaeon]